MKKIMYIILTLVAFNASAQDTTITKTKLDSLTKFYEYTCNILQHVTIARSGKVVFDKKYQFNHAYRQYIAWVNGRNKILKPAKF